VTVSIVVGFHIDGDGQHPAAWRDAAHEPSELLSAPRVRDVATRADAAGFSFVSFAGGHGAAGAHPNVDARLDPVLQAAFVAPITRTVGLIPTVPSTFLEPFRVSSQLASLDLSSRGRAGWIVTAEPGDPQARAFGYPVENDAERVRAELRDVVEVARQLWDTWEDDAIIRDAATSRYLDREKVHHLDFEGATFSVKGPGNTPRPPQGQLPVLGFDDGGELGHLDAVLLSGDVATLAAEAARLREAGVRTVLIDLEVALDARGESGDARVERMNVHSSWPESAAWRFTGPARGLADVIEQLAVFADGVRILPAVIDTELEELTRLVLPELRDRGIEIRTPERHGNLRAVFGLGVADNRFAVGAPVLQTAGSLR
jgi:alkanesulfonate monooxygenase SsuD/methylene tetrahydromethanopterin reductase-like flavin-dependent oxidoreductase (luciferase family)